MKRDEYRIGQFAKMTAMSPAALRIYDRMGILKPAVVNPDTGYRYYAAGQLEKAALIRLLRQLDVPLPEIKGLFRSRRPGDAQALLRAHGARLEQRLASISRAIDRLERAIGPDHELPPGRVSIQWEEPRLVVSRCAFTRVGEMDTAEYDEALRQVLRRLEARLAGCGLRALGRETVLHHNQTTWYEGLDIEVCLPVPRCSFLVLDDAWLLPGGSVATTRHLGPWSEVWASYAAVLSWVDREGYRICGPFRVTYQVDERDTRDSSRYAADVRVPVKLAD